MTAFASIVTAILFTAAILKAQGTLVCSKAEHEGKDFEQPWLRTYRKCIKAGKGNAPSEYMDGGCLAPSVDGSKFASQKVPVNTGITVAGMGKFICAADKNIEGVSELWQSGLNGETFTQCIFKRNGKTVTVDDMTKWDDGETIYQCIIDTRNKKHFLLLPIGCKNSEIGELKFGTARTKFSPKPSAVPARWFLSETELICSISADSPGILKEEQHTSPTADKCEGKYTDAHSTEKPYSVSLNELYSDGAFVDKCIADPEKKMPPKLTPWGCQKQAKGITGPDRMEIGKTEWRRVVDKEFGISHILKCDLLKDNGKETMSVIPVKCEHNGKSFDPGCAHIAKKGNVANKAELAFICEAETYMGQKIVGGRITIIKNAPMNDLGGEVCK